MEIKNAQEMLFEQVFNYLSEWFNNNLSSVIQNNEDGTKHFEIIDNVAGELIFCYDTPESSNKYLDDIVSTNGIVNDELRGIIEKTYKLDLQLKNSIEESKKQAQPNL